MLYPLWFWKTVIQRALYIITARKRQTALAWQVIRQREAAFRGIFIPATARKIAISHGIYNPMICDAFARLHGRKTSRAEQLRLIDYFTCSSLFDDFTDYPSQTDQELWQMSFAEDAYAPRDFAQRVFQHCHRALKSYVADKASYQEITRQLFDAQMESRRQAAPPAPPGPPAGGEGALGSQRENSAAVEERTGVDEITLSPADNLNSADLERITFAKGGLSVLLCSHYMDEVRSPAEQQCWYTIGTIIQLTNDLFDIWKDLQEGISTLPNTMRNPEAFETFFLDRIAVMKESIRALPVSGLRKQAFSLDMAGIYSFGLIALEQLKRLPRNGDRIDFGTYTRKQLIIDMEKPANLLRWFGHVYKQARLN